jgi:hypothetical protein
MSSSFASPFTRALDGGTLPLHCFIRSSAGIFSFSAKSAKVRNCLAQAAPTWGIIGDGLIWQFSSATQRNHAGQECVGDRLTIGPKPTLGGRGSFV